MDLKRLELVKKLGYKFSDVTKLDLALTHRSMGTPNNERLEFLGDSLLSTFVATALFQKFPQAKEGQLSRLRSQLVKGETLAIIAREYEFGDCLNLGEGERKSGGHRRDSILADAVEAMIGAVFLDSDLKTCRDVVLKWFEPRLRAVSLEGPTKDPKTQLQELLQSKNQPLPIYELTEAEGQDHQQLFTIACRVKGIEEPVSAQSSSRRKAEKMAAARALAQLNSQGQ